MKNLSFWAKKHQTQARWLIATAHLMLLLLAFLLGFLLWLNDFQYSSLSHDIFTTLFLLGIIGYPVKGAVSVLWRYSYQRHKAFDIAVVLTGFLSLSSLTHIKLEHLTLNNSEGYALKVVEKTSVEGKSVLSDLKGKTSWRALKKNLRLLKKELREVRKSIKVKGGDTILRLLGTILAILLAVGLGYLVAAWSCNLSCSGQEGAAGVVLIGGGALVIFLLVLAIRAIWKKKNKMKEPKLE